MVTWYDDRESFVVVARNVAGDIASELAIEVVGVVAEKADGASVTGVASGVGEFTLYIMQHHGPSHRSKNI